jgi:hypothetical protein
MAYIGLCGIAKMAKMEKQRIRIFEAAGGSKRKFDNKQK